MRVIPLALAALIAATPGIAGPQRDRVPAATPSGNPVDCLQLNRITNQVVRSDKVIDFFVGRQVFRNELPNACPQLGFESRFMHRTSLNQLCSTDTITVLVGPNLTQGATCGLGRFQPVTLARSAPAR